jgi:hypothetical protein
MPSQITCITKPHPHSPLEHITNVGGRRNNGAGPVFYITREACAGDIDTRSPLKPTRGPAGATSRRSPMRHRRITF